jgi:hypothetical protein
MIIEEQKYGQFLPMPSVRQELKRCFSLKAVLAFPFLKGLDPAFQNFTNVFSDTPGMQTAGIVL